METKIKRIFKTVEQRETSIEAYIKSLDIKREQHKTILKTMFFLSYYQHKKEVTGHEIANNCDLSYHQVLRRTKEMEQLYLIYVTGKKDGFMTFRLVKAPSSKV